VTREIVHPLWGSLALDRADALSLQEQVFAYFRGAIVEGRLRRGLRLPSSRQLASDHDISRTTAVEAYERLIAEGYLVARPGSGIFVAAHIPEDYAPNRAARSRRVQRRADGQHGVDVMDLRHYHLPLAPGMPAVDMFPWTEWSRQIAGVLRERPLAEIAHGDRFGERPLRESIADYLAAMKGIKCDPDQILVVGGTVQIFEAAVDLLLRTGARAIIEDPGYPFMKVHVRQMGFELIGGPVDAEGMDVATALARAPDAHFVFVSPSHNVPTGSSLSLARRKLLVDWSDRTGGWIIENEFDGDFRFASRPLPTCYSLARAGRVVMIGSVSKPFAPGLRVGYLLLPPELMDLAHEINLPVATVSTQLALARLSASGALATHLRLLRTVHERRRSLLLAALGREMPGLLELVHAPEAGLRVVTSLPDGTDDLALVIAALKVGVKVETLSACFVERPRRRGLMIGFGSTPDEEIAPAVARLAQVIRDRRDHCTQAATG
jgi:GntR family transcriptional regulator / MocR family aminotransferase